MIGGGVYTPVPPVGGLLIWNASQMVLMSVLFTSGEASRNVTCRGISSVEEMEGLRAGLCLNGVLLLGGPDLEGGRFGQH